MPARHIRSRHPETHYHAFSRLAFLRPAAGCRGRRTRGFAQRSAPAVLDDPWAVLITGGCSAPGPASPNRPAKAKWPWRKWNEHAAAINAASDTLARAANSPDEAAPLVVIDTFDACAAAADMMARLYRPAPSPPHDNAAVLGWMRNWLETIPGRCLPLCCASVPITPHVRARHWNP